MHHERGKHLAAFKCELEGLEERLEIDRLRCLSVDKSQTCLHPAELEFYGFFESVGVEQRNTLAEVVARVTRVSQVDVLQSQILLVL